MATRLRHKPLHLREANAYVTEFHRHHTKVQTHKFSIGAFDENDVLVGVVIVNRPCNIQLDDGKTCEVSRLCTHGTTPNVCSYLYGVAARVAKEMGYQSILTYILMEELGTTLKAAGWTCEGKAGGGTWNNNTRKRVDKHPITPKTRWRRWLNP